MSAFIVEKDSPGFSIGKIQDFAGDGTPPDSRTDERVVRFLDEFDWYLEALSERREKGVPY